MQMHTLRESLGMSAESGKHYFAQKLFLLPTKIYTISVTYVD